MNKVHYIYLYICLTLTILAGAAFFVLNPISAEAADVEDTGTDSGKLNWTYYDDGTLKISGTGAMRDAYSDDFTWLRRHASDIKTVKIEDGITHIGDYAFQKCTALTNITIPGSVESIGEYAFDGCSSLSSINIPENVTSISDSLFRNCSSLTSITIPENVTSIAGEAFSGSGLTSITIPENVATIKISAFNGCKNLETVEFNNADCSFGSQIFWGCSKLKSVKLPENMTAITSSMFRNCSALETITIPETVTSISSWAFSGSGLTSITIPDDVTTIGNNAFNDCKKLGSITIPGDVTSIGTGAFLNCSALTEIHIPTPNSSLSIDSTAFSGCSGDAKLIYADTANDGQFPTDIARIAYTDNGNGSINITKIIPVGNTKVSIGSDKIIVGKTVASVDESCRQYVIPHGAAGEHSADCDENDICIICGKSRDYSPGQEDEELTITFEYENENGETVSETVSFEPGAKYGELLPKPAKKGFIFGGWFSGKDGTGTKITADDEVSVGDPLTLYAKWIECDHENNTNDRWDWTVPPAQTTPGKAERTCSECGYTEIDENVPALSDSTVWTPKPGSRIEPTCGTNGSQEYTSDKYGDFTEILPATEQHNYADGSCTECGEPDPAHSGSGTDSSPAETHYPSGGSSSGGGAAGIAPAGASVLETVTVRSENKVTGESKNIKAVRDGDVVTVELGKENDGLYANILTKSGDNITSVLIEKGKAEFTLSKDVKFRIVIDSQAYGDDVSSAAMIYGDSDIMDNTAHAAVIIVPIAVLLTIILKRKRSVR